MEVVDKRGVDKPERKEPEPVVKHETPPNEVWCPVCKKCVGFLRTSAFPPQFITCRKCGIMYFHPDALADVNEKLSKQEGGNGGKLN